MDNVEGGGVRRQTPEPDGPGADIFLLLSWSGDVGDVIDFSEYFAVRMPSTVAALPQLVTIGS